MDTQKKLNDLIFLATQKIQEEYPELIKYLDEFPVHFVPNSNHGVKNKELKDYLESLNNLLVWYAIERKNKNQN